MDGKTIYEKFAVGDVKRVTVKYTPANNSCPDESYTVKIILTNDIVN
jgi:hypothetical protein